MTQISTQNGQPTNYNATVITLTDGQGAALNVDVNGNLKTSSSVGVVPATTTMQNAAVANGNGVTLNVQGYAVAILSVVSSVAMSGGTTINFECSQDDVTWVTLIAHLLGSQNQQSNTTTIDGNFRISTGGMKSVRARISAYSAGTVTIKGYPSSIAGHGTTVGVASFNFLNIPAGIATTVVKASSGTLHSIILNSAATATNTTIVYDHPSGVGTVIGRPAVTTATVPTTLIYDLAFANGLTIITATANGGDMTICYK